MADFVPLEALIHAIAAAVTDAQDQVERTQIANLTAYLDKDGRPLTLQMRVPSIRPDASAGEEDSFEAPLMGLVAHTLLSIKTMEITFDVQLGSVEEAPSPTAPRKRSPEADPQASKSPIEHRVTVNPTVTAANTKDGTSAHVVLTVESVPSPEGMSRLIDELIKRQTVSSTVDRGP